MAAFQGCPDCSKKGITSPIVPRRITETVAIWKCRNKDCIYPMSQSLDFFKSQFVPINSIDERLFSNYVSHDFRTPSCNSETASGNSFSFSDPIQTRTSPPSKRSPSHLTTLSKTNVPAEQPTIFSGNDFGDQQYVSLRLPLALPAIAQVNVPQKEATLKTNKFPDLKLKSIGIVSALSRSDTSKTASSPMIDVTARLKRKSNEPSEQTSTVSESGSTSSRPSSRPSRTPMDLQSMLKRIKRAPDTKGLNSKSDTTHAYKTDKAVLNLDKVYIRSAKLPKNSLVNEDQAAKTSEPRLNKPVTLYCSSQPFPGYSSSGNRRKNAVDCASEDGSSSAGGASDTNSVLKLSSAVRKTLKTNIFASIQQSSSPATVLMPQQSSIQQFTFNQQEPNFPTPNAGNAMSRLSNDISFPPFANTISNIPGMNVNNNFDLFNDTPPFLPLSNFWANNQQAQRQTPAPSVINSNFSTINDSASNHYSLAFDTQGDFMSDFLDNNTPLNNVYEQL